jgi:beta-glucosidase
VKNTGSRAGQETVIVFVRDDVATLTPAAKRVRRFAKVDLAPGETRQLGFTIRAEDLGYIGLDNKFHFEPGDFTVMVGNQMAKFSLK